MAHGRYRHPGYGPMQDEDDAAPQAVLLPGDIAPCWLQLGPTVNTLAERLWHGN